MSEKSYSQMLRNLANEYYEDHIGFEEYRAQRKTIIDRIDEEFNGTAASPGQSDGVSDAEDDKASLFMQTVSFFRNRDGNG